MTWTGPPVLILIAGQLLRTWTSMRLSRRKQDLTGDLSITVYFGIVPDAPVLPEVADQKDVQVYIYGHLVFNGEVAGRKADKKKQSAPNTKTQGSGSIARGTGHRGGGTRITATEYVLTISATGKTRRLIQSSHKHKTGSFYDADSQKIVQELIDPWPIDLDWQAESRDVGTWRLEDGGTVVDQIHTLGNEKAHYLWEGRDGRLICSDGTLGQQGEALIMGRNILDYSAEQKTDHQNAEYEVKGQRNRKAWGKAAVNRKKTLKNSDNKADTKLSIQAYGDGDDDTLERRAQFEADNRNAADKQVRIGLFGLAQSDGTPWDVGLEHYVEVPSENVYDAMECTELTITTDGEKEFGTQLTLTPLPSKSGGAGLAGVAGRSGAQAIAAQRRQQLGIKPVAGRYPSSWGPPDLVAVAEEAAVVTQAVGLAARVVRQPPLVAPAAWAEPGFLKVLT